MSRTYRSDDEYQRSPAVRAKMSAASKRAWADPACRLAQLPITPEYVARAADLFAQGECREIVVDFLQQEFAPRRARRA